MTRRREVLLLLGPSQPLDARVTQRVSPRMVLVELEGDAPDGVLAVLEPGESLPEHLRATLTETEALFAAAFAQRSRPKSRAGEGLDWNFPGGCSH